ncbi:hypothetical protein EOA79_26760 [Mesorhizobium sp. M1A.F.Ca.IN.020.03.2.1]|nr:hypothetical protein EOA79_26760 [Mesorhizobium sp. M1A.F.Ca.IN.020.03.2.1]RWG87172.1 MAG: hypothetical protein EOQ70_14230 [Mesorhizobium sp.]RWK18292.1 MAG: hypothetical protein EOR41_14265 [Mesorhizobium sp.]
MTAKNFPHTCGASSQIKILGRQGAPLTLRPCGCKPLSGLPRNSAITQVTGATIMNPVISYFQATGRNLRTFLGKIVSHFFRRGSVALKIAVKLPSSSRQT